MAYCAAFIGSSKLSPFRRTAIKVRIPFPCDISARAEEYLGVCDIIPFLKDPHAPLPLFFRIYRNPANAAKAIQLSGMAKIREYYEETRMWNQHMKVKH